MQPFHVRSIASNAGYVFLYSSDSDTLRVVGTGFDGTSAGHCYREMKCDAEGNRGFASIYTPSSSHVAFFFFFLKETLPVLKRLDILLSDCSELSRSEKELFTEDIPRDKMAATKFSFIQAGEYLCFVVCRTYEKASTIYVIDPSDRNNSPNILESFDVDYEVCGCMISSGDTLVYKEIGEDQEEVSWDIFVRGAKQVRSETLYACVFLDTGFF